MPMDGGNEFVVNLKKGTDKYLENESTDLLPKLYGLSTPFQEQVCLLSALCSVQSLACTIDYRPRQD